VRLPVYPTDEPSEDVLPDRDYFWSVFNTAHNEEVTRVIRSCYEQRARGLGEDEDDKIQIRRDLYKAIMDAPFFASK